MFGFLKAPKPTLLRSGLNIEAIVLRRENCRQTPMWQLNVLDLEEAMLLNVMYNTHISIEDFMM